MTHDEALKTIRDKIQKALSALEVPTRNPYDAYPELKDAEIALAALITARDERIRQEVWQSIDIDNIDDDFDMFLNGFTDVDGERYEKRAARNGGEWMKHLIRAAIMEAKNE